MGIHLFCLFCISVKELAAEANVAGSTAGSRIARRNLTASLEAEGSKATHTQLRPRGRVSLSTTHSKTKVYRTSSSAKLPTFQHQSVKPQLLVGGNLATYCIKQEPVTQQQGPSPSQSSSEV